LVLRSESVMVSSAVLANIGWVKRKERDGPMSLAEPLPHT